MTKPKIVRINMNNYGIAKYGDWDKWSILANELQEAGLLREGTNNLGVSEFLRNSHRIIDKQIRKLNRKPKPAERCEYLNCKQWRGVERVSNDEGLFSLCKIHRERAIEVRPETRVISK